MATQGDVVLREGQRFAPGDRNLQMDEVEAGNQLGDWMFDLEPGIHLQKIEIAGSSVRGIFQQELDGAGVGVSSRLREPDGGCTHPLAEFLADYGRGRFFYHFLVTALD